MISRRSLNLFTLAHPTAKSISTQLMGLSLLGFTLTSCQPVAKEVKPEQIAEFNKPGIVLVRVKHTVEYEVAKPEVDRERVAGLVQTMQEKVANGQLTTQAESEAFIFSEMIRNPSKYMRPGEKSRGTTDISGTGTGFVVAPGTIATAAHVVSNEGQSIKKRVARTTLKDLTVATCREIIKRRETKSESTVNNCINGFAEYFSKNIELGKIQTQTAVVMQAAMPGQDSSAKVIPSEIKKMGQKIPKEDVAILTIANGENLPVLKLGDSTPITAGNKVLSIGFPGNITDLFIKDKNLPEPTLTSGNVSAIQDSLIQTEAAVSPGNSGGPLFNDKGEVIGIASFIATNGQGGNLGGGNFFVPVSVLKQFLQESNITPTVNPITQTYQKAISSFQDKNFREALTQFKDVQDRNPEFPYIQQKISLTKPLINETDSSIPNWGIGVVLGLVAIGVGSVLGKVYLKRKSETENASS